MKRINGRVLSSNGGQLFVARGRKIYMCDALGNNPIKWFFFKVNFISSFMMNFYIFRRLFRLGFHHLACSSYGSVIFVNKQIWYQSKIKSHFTGFINGSRPLVVCAADSRFFYGEYRRNKERNAVSIFELAWPYKTWSKIISIKGVRHIHGIFFDKYENCFWITTGDLDSESRIYRCDKDFSNLRIVVSGSQQVRTITLLFKKDFVYFGSDTPDEKNHIYRISRKDNMIQQLQEVEGSVFYGCKSDKCLFFTTAVEPSNVNKNKKIEVWSSENGTQWALAETYNKDFLPMKYFQYGQARILMNKKQNSNEVIIVPFATSLFEVSEIFEIRKSD